MLLANQAHLRPWIPESTWSAPPLPQLAERLDEWAANFSTGRAFRYAMRHVDDGRILGGMSLFPRDESARVMLDRADRIELGYWLDAAATGRGLVTEASGVLLDAATSLPGVKSAEIRCHMDNVPSNAVPRRLGFELVGLDGEMQVWREAITRIGIVTGDALRP